MKMIRKLSPQILSVNASKLFTISIFAILLLLSNSMTQVASAALISFAPNRLSISATQGEEVTIPYSVSLAQTSLPDAYAQFTLQQISGNLIRSWVTGVGSVSLSASQPTQNHMLTVQVPANAPEGSYTGVYRTLNLNSNQSVSPVFFFVSLKVEAKQGCTETPAFRYVETQETLIQAKNDEPYTIEFNGNIATPNECPITKSWYQLSDEYGELDEMKEIAVDADGNFSASISVLAKRSGNDKDGRKYTIVFGAENDAGTSEGGETTVVVSHDNRKK